MVTIVYEVLSY